MRIYFFFASDIPSALDWLCDQNGCINNEWDARQQGAWQEGAWQEGAWRKAWSSWKGAGKDGGNINNTLIFKPSGDCIIVAQKRLSDECEPEKVLSIVDSVLKQLQLQGSQIKQISIWYHATDYQSVNDLDKDSNYKKSPRYSIPIKWHGYSSWPPDTCDVPLKVIEKLCKGDNDICGWLLEKEGEAEKGEEIKERIDEISCLKHRLSGMFSALDLELQALEGIKDKEEFRRKLNDFKMKYGECNWAGEFDRAMQLIMDFLENFLENFLKSETEKIKDFLKKFEEIKGSNREGNLDERLRRAKQLADFLEEKRIEREEALKRIQEVVELLQLLRSEKISEVIGFLKNPEDIKEPNPFKEWFHKLCDKLDPLAGEKGEAKKEG